VFAISQTILVSKSLTTKQMNALFNRQEKLRIKQLELKQVNVNNEVKLHQESISSGMNSDNNSKNSKSNSDTEIKNNNLTKEDNSNGNGNSNSNGNNVVADEVIKFENFTCSERLSNIFKFLMKQTPQSLIYDEE